MALIQVPYNNAMRLGQGFNTYTQEICIDNAVVGTSTGESYQPVMPASTTTTAGTSTTVPGDGSSNTTVSDGTANIITPSITPIQTVISDYPSQIVTYYSKYVSKLSDLADNMNISGSLSIRYGEISGGGSGSYVDVETFQNSDINFLISVKVVNQTINTRDQLAFWALKGDKDRDLTASEFTKTYGDSFISGFQEGGQFFAVVSIKTLDSEQKTDIKAAAHLALQVGVGEVEADGSVELAKQNLKKNSEINITVNWSGGGQLKEGGEKWDIDTLTEVAVRFPDLVATCPQRTHAIVTKYTALRGYLEWKADNNKTMTPLNYELASLYTSDLLDVYMGYKVIWDDIHGMLDAMDSGTTRYMNAPQQPDSMVRAPDKPTDESKRSWVQGDEIRPFASTYAGLGEAVKVCRQLMVRIVVEVDDITTNPALVIDPDRPLAYIRPQVFRELLPVPYQTPDAVTVFGEKDVQFPLMDSTIPVNTSLPAGGVGFGSAAFGSVGNSILAGVGSPPTVGAPISLSSQGTARIGDTQSQVISYAKCTVRPTVVMAMSLLDMYHEVGEGHTDGYRLCARTFVSEVATTGALIKSTVVSDPAANNAPAMLHIPNVAKSYALGAHALVVPANDDRISAGTYTKPWAAHSESGSSPMNACDATDRISFVSRYSSTPNVVVWLSGFDRYQLGPISVVVWATDIDNTGFNFRTQSASGDIYQVSVSWVAFPTTLRGIACGNSRRPTFYASSDWASEASDHVTFDDGFFETPPKVFVAMSGFVFGESDQLRLRTADLNVTARGFDWSASTWARSQFIDASVGWLAIAQ